MWGGKNLTKETKEGLCNVEKVGHNDIISHPHSQRKKSKRRKCLVDFPKDGNAK
jgi:hypothetical protein